MNKETVKKIFDLKSDLLKLYEKNGSVKNVRIAFKNCERKLKFAGFELLNNQNDLLVDDLTIKIYTLTLSGETVLFFVIFSPLTNSMFFPFSLETNCPPELISLSKTILDKMLYIKQSK